MNSYGLYLHIPYCASKCKYCDFYSIGRSGNVPQEYVDALISAIKNEKKRLHLSSHASTVYLGGGTPGLLTAEQVKNILQAAEPCNDAEITLETNPELVTSKHLEELRKCGVNRISFGIQTADDESLRRIGRLHSSADALRALKMAKDAGFDHICADIMLGLPYYSFSEFDRTLELILEGGADHISSYLLKIEPHTPFGISPPGGLPDDDSCADYYLYAVEQIEKAGLKQYEISNFSIPGCEGQHNLRYWNCQNYLGIGPAAHSCVNNKRFYYPSSLKDFIKGTLNTVPDGECTLSDEIMLHLRLVSGLSFSYLQEKYGFSFSESQKSFMKKCSSSGYGYYSPQGFSLSPAGFAVQNSILTELLPD